MRNIFTTETVSKAKGSAPAATSERRLKSPSKTNGGPPPNQPIGERFPALEKQEVALGILAPEANKVEVAGSFNGWQPSLTPLRNIGAGDWRVRLMLRAGEYEYRFVVDGQWVDDPLATQSVANPFGSYNSVLKVELDVTTDIL